MVQPSGSSYTYRLRFREDRNNRMPAHRPGGRVERHSSWLLWRVHSLEQPSRTAALCLNIADVEAGMPEATGGTGLAATDETDQLISSTKVEGTAVTTSKASVSGRSPASWSTSARARSPTPSCRSAAFWAW